MWLPYWGLPKPQVLLGLPNGQPLLMAMYHIWHQGNAILHCQGIRTEEGIMQSIKSEVKVRVKN